MEHPTNMSSEINKGVSEKLIDRDKAYPRDRIVVIGRRSSGKTVYISLLYEKLWKSNGSIKVKAVKGMSHAQFIKTAEGIRHDQWPPATQGISQSFIEVDYHDQNRLMVVLDYPGELFTDAFVKDVESKEVDTLLEHIDRASAVILLVDPAHVVEGDIDSQIDHNYGFLQAVNRIQNWPGGKDIPVVLIFTKIDINYPVLKQHGGTRSFVEKYFSSLIKATRHLKVCKISAISDEASIIKDDLCSLEKPLQYCLDRLSEIEAKTDGINRNRRIKNFCEQLEKKERLRNIVTSSVWLLLWSILFVLLLMAVLHFLPSTVWTNLWYNITGQ
jgi:hypothetical protein